uniref:CSON009815 protein n=1 Tax=Culicoides sonorensis TaxID=179676 RepID=A0A336N2V2_CULSO
MSGCVKIEVAITSVIKQKISQISACTEIKKIYSCRHHRDALEQQVSIRQLHKRSMPSIYALGVYLTLLGLLAILLENVSAQQGPPAQVCPTASEISPCVCQVKKNGLDILCEATDYNHITRAMSALKGKNPIIFYLKLRHNNLPKLQGFLFLALDIRHLTIHNSSLAAIEETSLSSLGKGLTQLDVSQNQLTKVPSTALKNLHHLLIFNANHNRITQIHAKAFEGLDTLEILTMYENKINLVEPDAFRGLEKKLKRLNLGGNQLQQVPQRALAILDTLKKLEIQENKIKKIKEGDFEGLRNLDSLILAHNQLSEVPANVFRHLTQLNSLELEGNQISVIDKDAFAGLEGKKMSFILLMTVFFLLFVF